MLNPPCMSNAEFINKLIGDIEKLNSCGFSNEQAKRMVGQLDYVRDFVDTPDWLEISGKLPKGYKWSDGQKFHKKSGKKNGSETYVFIEIGNDLYLKGILNIYEQSRSEIVNGSEVKTHYKYIKDNRICLIRDWKRIPEPVARKYLGNTVFLDDSISKYWFQNNERSSVWKRKK